MDWVSFWVIVSIVYIVIAVLTMLWAMAVVHNGQKIFVLFLYHCMILFQIYAFYRMAKLG